MPPATAYLLTERLERMLALAVLLGITSAVGGYALARWWDASIAGAMAAVAGLQFLAALLVSPGHGLLALALTGYVLIGMRYEERDLADTFGASYRSWRKAAT